LTLILRLAIVTIGISLGILLKWAPASGYLSLLLPTLQNGRTDTLYQDPLIGAAIVTGIKPATASDTFDPLAAYPGVGGLFVHDRRATFHAHGERMCASGCAASRHPTETLTREQFFALRQEMTCGPLDETNRALETLLYYGRQSRDLLSREGFGPLGPRQGDFLWAELARTHARISLRIVDESGQVRSKMRKTIVPLDRRHVFEMESHNLQPLITSGTVKRVGLDHLWTRL
jgi:hypothetical protein